MAKKEHQFVFRDGCWYCTVCQWNWRMPQPSECPGVPRYDHDTLPSSMKPIPAALRASLSPDACYWRRVEPHWIWFYNARKRSVLPAGKEQVLAMCELCGEEIIPEEDHSPHAKKANVCTLCQFELRWLYERHKIEQWASEVWGSSRAAIVTTETTGLGDRDVVIELVLVPLQDPRSLWRTYIRSQQPISSEATEVHHLRDKDLLSAPLFPSVWSQVVTLLQKHHPIVSYHAPSEQTQLDSATVRSHAPVS
jgi:hypothetical protein